MKSIVLPFLVFTCFNINGQDLRLQFDNYKISNFPGNTFDRTFYEIENSPGLRLFVQKTLNITKGDSLLSIMIQDKAFQYFNFIDYDEIQSVIDGIDYIRSKKMYIKEKNHFKSTVYTRNGMCFGIIYNIYKPDEWSTFVQFDIHKPETLVYMRNSEFSSLSENLKKVLKRF
ncbi:hypothetical protein MCERE19_02206 [Spirosomataceae bacterium]|jgi:hypothetical protein